MLHALSPKWYLSLFIGVGLILTSCGGEPDETGNPTSVSSAIQDSEDTFGAREELIENLEAIPAARQSLKDVCDLWVFQLEGAGLVKNDQSPENMLLIKLLDTLEMKQLEILYNLQLSNEELTPIYQRLMILYLATNSRVGKENIPENETTVWSIFTQDFTEEDVGITINDLYDRMRIQCSQFIAKE